MFAAMAGNGQMGVPGMGKPGDWACPACGDHQFAKNIACRRCGTAKPAELGGAFAGGGGGGWGGPVRKPGDWDCPGCGDLQFARNTACRKCGTPNPAGGGGGGGAVFGGGGGPAGIPDNRAAVYVKGLTEGTDVEVFRKVISEYGSIKDCKMVGVSTAYVHFGDVSEAQWVVTNLDGNIPEGMDCAVKVSFASAAATGAGPPAQNAGKGGFTPYGGAPGGATMQMQGGGGCGFGNKGFGGGMAMGGKGNGTGGGVQTMKRMLQAASTLPGGRWTNNDKTVVIKGLPDDSSDKDLYDIFSPFGAIHSEGVRALHWEDGRCKGTAFVNFIDLEGAIKACATLNNFLMPNGMQLKVYRQDMDGADFGKKSGDWNCPACSDLQFAKNTACRKCGTPNPDPEAAAAAAAPEMKPGDWACPSCSDIQFAKNAACRKCGTANPNPPAFGATFGGPQVMPGDWSCTSCGDLQFARNPACRKCGAPKPDGLAAGVGAVGGMMPMGMPQMMSGFGGCGGGGPPQSMAGDWNCPACGDHQFARNTACRKCGSPRP